jgi:hypothetical protein
MPKCDYYGKAIKFDQFESFLHIFTGGLESLDVVDEAKQVLYFVIEGRLLINAFVDSLMNVFSCCLVLHKYYYGVNLNQY